ncbi:endonuclease 8-like 1 isoform X2 [Esox lucius]|nr:endonuclease 8-like 1 isoform X2 [Esox lucius]
MPEGPELHLASLFVNRMCRGVVFTGPVHRSEVSKNPQVPFCCPAYTITATSRGKEVRLTLSPLKSDPSLGSSRRVKAGKADQEQSMDVVFRFGMSGFFRFTTADELPKHAHLRFYTNEKPSRVLSFVDARRFGSWQPSGTWQADRGPCVMFEYQSFRENVLSNLNDRAFDRPICEVLLNQKYFNGIGNYLRAEILFRLNIPPFVKARTVLEVLQSEDLGEEKSTYMEVKEEVPDMNITNAEISSRTTVKEETDVEKLKEEVTETDLLSLCNSVPLEVIKLGGKGYDPEKNDYSEFKAWLRCYYVEGMRSIRDHNGRTIWFKGDPGPLTPKVSKSPKAKKRLKNEDVAGKKKIIKADSTENAMKAKPVKKEVPQRQTEGKSVTDFQEVRVETTGRRISSPGAPLRRSGRKTRSSALL